MRPLHGVHTVLIILGYLLITGENVCFLRRRASVDARFNCKLRTAHFQHFTSLMLPKVTFTTMKVFIYCSSTLTRRPPNQIRNFRNKLTIYDKINNRYINMNFLDFAKIYYRKI